MLIQHATLSLSLFSVDSLYGELTDLGFQSTYEMGQRLRRVYIEQLGLLPDLGKLAFDKNGTNTAAAPATGLTLDEAQSMVYFRSTNMQRTIESLQSIVTGLLAPTGQPFDEAMQPGSSSSSAPTPTPPPSSSASSTLASKNGLGPQAGLAPSSFPPQPHPQHPPTRSSSPSGRACWCGTR